MKILVISSTPWNVNNSFGNSFSNILDGIPGIKIANIYCQPGMPDVNLEIEAFQITEHSLLKNLRCKIKPSGKVVIVEKSSNVSTAGLSHINGVTFAKKYRWQILFWARDMIWKLGRWKSPELERFIKDFNPDIIFQPIYYSSYLNDIVQWAKEYTKAPMLGYISDDCYTLKQFRFSPLYWIDRLWKRRKVKRTIELCEILYVISEVQKNEYEGIFKVPCKVLTKCADFSAPVPAYQKSSDVLTMIYAGNLGDGRWQSLALLARAIAKENKEKVRVQLDIYTPTPFSRKMKAAFNTLGCTVYPPITAIEVLERQKESDVLVHVEGLSLKSRLAVRQSFSTKLVDFFALGKCVFAIGPKDVASIKHLIDNDAAVVAHHSGEVAEKLNMLLKVPDLLKEYGQKAYYCGALNHSRSIIQAMLQRDFLANLNKDCRA